MKQRLLHPLLILAILLNGLVLVHTIGVQTPIAAADCTPGVLQIVSQDPTRAHRVMAGTRTSFILQVKAAEQPLMGAVYLQAAVPGWTAALTRVNTSFQPTGSLTGTLRLSIPMSTTQTFGIMIQPGKSLAVGTSATFEVRARFANNVVGCAQVSAIVYNRPRAYLTLLDGGSRAYLDIDRYGQPLVEGGEPLMPNARAYRAKAIDAPSARSSLPAVTDPNIFGIISGAWPGTSGIYNVSAHPGKWKDDGTFAITMPSKERLLWGSDGQAVKTIFDVIKDPAFGGDSQAFGVFVSGKSWNLEYLRDAGRTVDLLVGGAEYPWYISAPQPYTIGDPPSDPDAADDREGVNLTPPEEYRMKPPAVGLLGDNPEFTPSTRWLTESALKIIAAEDPEVLVLHYGVVDVAQHAWGSADRPSEWTDPQQTPLVTWDDVTPINRRANRSPVLDEIYEADACFGLLLRSLQWRGMTAKAYTVLTADHSLVTVSPQWFDLEGHLEAHDMSDEIRGIDYAFSDFSARLFLWDASKANDVASMLETVQVPHPVTGQLVRPAIAITRDEMISGVDTVIGRFAREGTPERAELYSQWNIEHGADGVHSILWPDIFVFLRYRLSAREPGSALGAHAGLDSSRPLWLLAGPGLAPRAITDRDVALVDIVPTLYQLMGLTSPPSVDGQSIFSPSGVPPIPLQP